MRNLTVKLEDNTFVVREETARYGLIIFDQNNLEATIHTRHKVLQVIQGADKNMVLTENGTHLFTFAFDHVWGGAELVSNGVDTGLDIKGRWFKPGTRLTDAQDEDMVVAVKSGNGLTVSVLHEDTDDTLVMATIYYHLYASAGKMRAVMMGV